ncbi:MAG: NADP-specific glutamate dehydrogenase [candidate division Zixibacteria bacterium]|nr:NADP-specific glutamate dehydrogenase [candidate division Zixibacteria bacterium]
MSGYVAEFMDWVRAKNPGEAEYSRAIEGLAESVAPVMERHPEYHRARILERLVEPERAIMFRIPWTDDNGTTQVNRGYRVEMNSAIGPYAGGLRFHPTVSLEIVKYLAFEQVFRNSLTTLPMGGAHGGADFDPKGKSDDEVMRFCTSFMIGLFPHLGAHTDILGSDIGVGSREIGYLFGAYRKLRNEFTGVLTGKGTAWSGSLVRPEATGYGAVYFAAEMLATRGETLEGKTCLVSGSGRVAQSAIEKIIDLGGRAVSFSDANGYIHDPSGIDRNKLAFVKDLRSHQRGDIRAYGEKYPEASYVAFDSNQSCSPLLNHKGHCAFPAATQYEINAADAANLVKNGVRVVSEGATMPTSPEAVRLFLENRILYGPAKAASAGGAAVAGLEMSQNSMRYSWTREEVDNKLHGIMKHIHKACLEASESYGAAGDYVVGADIAAFIKVADAMIAQGLHG